MASAKATVDHDEIRKWVEARGGFPAHVKRTGEGDDPGVLRIDYPGFSGQDTLERLEWDEFFEAFDANKLAFLYQDTRGSRFSKFVDRKSVKVGGSPRKSAAKRATGSKGGTKKRSSASSSKKSSSARSSSTSTGSKKGSKRPASSAKRSSSAKRTSSKSSGRSTASSSRATGSRKASSKKSASSKSGAKKSSAKRSTSSRTATKGRATSRTGAKASSSKTRSAKSSAKRSSSKAAGSKRSASVRSGSSGRTTNHDEIRRWVEARGGFPARVKSTGRKNDPGILRIDYPGYSGAGTLERIDWDEWFEWFDRDKLAFLYQNKPKSRFSKLVAR